MARHDLAAPAPREPAAVARVERVEPPDEAVRAGRTTERPGDSACDRRVPDRIEPDVWVEPLAARGSRTEIDAVEDVERRAAPPLGRLLHRGLEPVADVHEEPCLLHAADVPGRELEVVRLGAGRREVHDLGRRTGDLARRVRQRIEGRDDGIALRRVGAAPGEAEHQPRHAQENDSRKHGRRA